MGGGKEEGGRESQARFLQTQELEVGPDLKTWAKMKIPTLNQLNHPGTLTIMFYLPHASPNVILTSQGFILVIYLELRS